VSKFLGKITVGSKPDAIALSTGERYLYVANSASGDLTIYNIRNAATREGRRLVAMIPLGKRPNAIAIKTFAAK
jgi:DNA-binding beta-propeller fold protein YncE